MSEGKADIVVGTHALLSENVHFRELGLVIVDEEQHFGVKQKERLKALRGDLHVLTLTATPIPRTLQMALSGVREMSIISTPPVDRLAVRTFVLPFDPVVVREAVLREHWRGGQTFYVCPRIEDLREVEEHLTKLVPEVKIAVAHGRMGARELETVMTAFYEGKYDVLLSTTIIESGLDGVVGLLPRRLVGEDAVEVPLVVVRDLSPLRNRTHRWPFEAADSKACRLGDAALGRPGAAVGRSEALGDRARDAGACSVFCTGRGEYVTGRRRGLGVDRERAIVLDVGEHQRVGRCRGDAVRAIDLVRSEDRVDAVEGSIAGADLSEE
jgi:hypothetical protein